VCEITGASSSHATVHPLGRDIQLSPEGEGTQGIAISPVSLGRRVSYRFMLKRTLQENNRSSGEDAKRNIPGSLYVGDALPFVRPRGVSTSTDATTVHATFLLITPSWRLVGFTLEPKRSREPVYGTSQPSSQGLLKRDRCLTATQSPRKGTINPLMPRP
jgi:hypothetical protein